MCVFSLLLARATPRIRIRWLEAMLPPGSKSIAIFGSASRERKKKRRKRKNEKWKLRGWFLDGEKYVLESAPCRIKRANDQVNNFDID